MSLSKHEHALTTAGVALSHSPLGVALQKYHPGRRTPHEAPSVSQLARMELNTAPAVRRTLAVLFTANATGFDLRLSNEDRTYIAWVQEVHAFLQAMADRWWGGVNPDIRMLFVDGDEVPPLLWSTSYIPALRISHPPSLDVAGARLGLTNGDLAELSLAWKEARRTAVYEAATAARDKIRRDRPLRNAITVHGASIRARFASAVPTTTTDESARLRRLIAEAYDDVAPDVAATARALRDYNELVQVGLACVLGFAEDLDSLVAVTLDPSIPATCAITRRRLDAHLTLTGREVRPLHLLTPFVLEDDGPLDGIYLATAMSFQLAADKATADVSGFRVRNLEMAS